LRIKPYSIKNLGDALLVRQREYFTKNFDENREQLGLSASTESKRAGTK